MEKLFGFIIFIDAYISTFGLLIALIGGIFAWWKFREYIKDRRFTTYHRLIDELVDDKSHQSGNLMLDRQIAIIFELRNFPKYYKVTTRILEGLKNEAWKIGNPRLTNEVDLTLEYIKSNKFCRLFKK